MNKEEENKVTTIKLAKAMATWFVRANNFYYTVEKPTQRRSQKDVKQIALQRFITHYPHIRLSESIVADVFKMAIEGLSTDPSKSIPVWDGTIVPEPGNTNRLIQRDGEVSINSWVPPSYRSQDAGQRNSNLFFRLLEAMMPNVEDQAVVTDWLSWSLQNERNKPGFAPILYSRRKGTGKSTLCKLIAALFGQENSITQNNIEKVASQFNQPILQKKFVVAEEIQLRADSNQGNALKTFITEKEVASERKGKDIETIHHACCFMGTTNHFPSWIEEGERRFWVIDCDHDGHASGPKAAEFAELVGEVNRALEDPQELATMYQSLMKLRQRETFNPHSLNLGEPKTEIMRRVMASSREVILQLLEENLKKKGVKAISLKDLQDLFVIDLKTGVNRIRHLMPELGWSSVSAKWGGVDHVRVVWVHPGYQLSNGALIGPEGFRETFEGKTGGSNRRDQQFEIIETMEPAY